MSRFGARVFWFGSLLIKGRRNGGINTVKTELGTVDLMGLDKDLYLDLLHERDLNICTSILQNLSFFVIREGIGSVRGGSIYNVLNTVLGHKYNESIGFDTSDISLLLYHLILEEQHSKQSVGVHGGVLSHTMFLIQY